MVPTETAPLIVEPKDIILLTVSMEVIELIFLLLPAPKIKFCQVRNTFALDTVIWFDDVLIPDIVAVGPTNSRI